ncbi:MAG: hypothetical protein JWM18_910 [Chloroflexi bacterium]|jgi:hypothetical protein|nr:hypothetical protein [Chloroflexota bacterium]
MSAGASLRAILHRARAGRQASPRKLPEGPARTACPPGQRIVAGTAQLWTWTAGAGWTTLERYVASWSDDVRVRTVGGITSRTRKSGAEVRLEDDAGKPTAASPNTGRSSAQRFAAAPHVGAPRLDQPETLTTHLTFALQRLVGNAAVAHLLHQPASPAPVRAVQALADVTSPIHGAGGGTVVQRAWTADQLMKLFGSDDNTVVVATLLGNGYQVKSFEKAFDTWKYDADGREEEVELRGLSGNTNTTAKVIRIREDLPPQEAAGTLFHETGHVRSKVKDYLKQEIAVRVEEELFLIRRGWPPAKPSWRKKDGTVDEDAIRKDIEGSVHYNPMGRTRTGRRYEGEKDITGWKYY